MAKGYVVATMSSGIGYETKSPEAALALHFTYYFTSRRDQGKVLGDTPSFYFTWKQYGEVPDTLIARSKTELESYIKELFSDVKVSVSRELIEGSTQHYTLQFAARVVVDGKTVDLAQAVYVTGQQYKVLDQRRLG